MCCSNNYAVEIKNLNIAYEHKSVIKNLSLNIEKGKITAIIGPNGAGKSTLLKAILNLVKPLSGTIKINIDKNIKGKIGYIPQNGSIDWDFPTTVIDVVLMGTYGSLGWIKRPRKKEMEMAHSVLKKVEMLDFSKRQISQLSGGQQQRVFLARALIQQAEVLFLDEPLKGVDVNTEDIIISHLKELKNHGKTIILVHHNLQTVTDYFDNVILMNKTLIANGTVASVFNEINIKNTYENSK